MSTPIAFLVFNRPQCTMRVLDQIRCWRPTQLLVVADGPRACKPSDVELCAEVRRIIDQGIDWPCDLKKNYAEHNMGCAQRVSSGLDWAFALSERLIILEDDCVPDISFFRFCEELLERFAEDKKVGQICGCPRYFDFVDRKHSYLFSHYGPVWGWASWRRAWSFYDLQIKDWPAVKSSGRLRAVTQSRIEYNKRVRLYDSLFAQPPTTWDYQWGYAKMTNSLLSVIPCQNLIENIGFDGSGTHHVGGNFGLKQRTMRFPLDHPSIVAQDLQFDRAYANVFASRPSIVRFLRSKIYKIFKTK